MEMCTGFWVYRQTGLLLRVQKVLECGVSIARVYPAVSLGGPHSTRYATLFTRRDRHLPFHAQGLVSSRWRVCVNTGHNCLSQVH